MKKLIPIGMALVVLLSSCVTPADKTDQVSSSESDMVCVKEKKTGSNRTVSRCHPRDRSAIREEQTQQDLRRMQNQNQPQTY